MSDLNNWNGVGRLVRDAELKYAASGFAIGNFSLAVNRRVKNGEQWNDEVSFIDCTLFGKQAESLKQYLVKGKQLAVSGELRQERWTEKDSGQTRSKISVVAHNVQLLGGEQKAQEQKSGYRENAQKEAPSGHNADFSEDVPF
ncbi:MAG: single-stranded DNA-binding protein [Treponemataceae bacterium]|nr:MAG: single-stranded DNA-binding protein [Treponemataceae bacterium]